MSESYNYVYKIILLGDSTVGKSSLMRRFVENKFDFNTSTTFGVDNLTKCVEIDEEKIMLSIWDTAGQEKYQSIVPAYFRGSHAGIFIYDITNESSFFKVNYWLGQARELSAKDITFVLIGNKADLDSQRKVSQKSALDLARNNNMLFFETSCLTSENVESAFMQLVQRLYGKEEKAQKKTESTHSVLRGISIQGNNSVKENPEKAKCCGRQ